MSAPLRLSDLRVTWPGTHFRLEVPELELVAGRVTVVAGASGSGKSTLGCAWAGLLPYLGARIRGRVTFAAGEADLGNRKEWKPLRGRAVRWIPQDPARAFTPTRPLLRQVLEGCAPGPERDEQLARLLKVLGLPAAEELRRRAPFELSGGMLQRAAMVSAFLPGPELVVADEPTAFLDPPRSLTLARIVTALSKATSAAVLWITHDLRLAAAVADRVILLEEGKVAADEPPDLILNPMGESPSALVRASARLALPL